MKRFYKYALVIVALPMLMGSDWTQFRGPGGASVSKDSVPTKFDNQTNVAWKTDLPAKGASGPIVIGDRVIVTCSGGDNQEQLYTICLDANTGKRIWTQQFWATGRTLCHPLSSNAAPTPTTDGKQIYAFYSSNDLACMDMDGNLVWYRGLAVDFPKAGNDVGMSASPIVHDGVVVVSVESQGASFAMGLDTKTGKTLWRNERKKTACWTSPLLMQDGDGKPQVALQSSDRMSVLDLKTGKVTAEFEGEGNVIPSPATMENILLSPINGTTAYKVSGGNAVELWNSPKIRPGTASAIVFDNKIFALNRAGVLVSYDAKDGKELSKVRVGGSYWSTPVVAGSHMYFFTQDGRAKVVSLGDEMKVVHETEFEGEVFLGSPAIADSALYFRSDKSIWKITGG